MMIKKLLLLNIFLVFIYASDQHKNKSNVKKVIKNLAAIFEAEHKDENLTLKVPDVISSSGYDQIPGVQDENLTLKVPDVISSSGYDQTSGSAQKDDTEFMQYLFPPSKGPLQARRKAKRPVKAEYFKPENIILNYEDLALKNIQDPVKRQVYEKVLNYYTRVVYCTYGTQKDIDKVRNVIDLLSKDELESIRDTAQRSYLEKKPLPRRIPVNRMQQTIAMENLFIEYIDAEKKEQVLTETLTSIFDNFLLSQENESDTISNDKKL